MRIFTFAAFILFTAFCVIVAVANRTIVSFSLDPLPFAWDMPLYILLFAGIFIGFGAGALVMMAKSVKHAHHNRQQSKKITALEQQVTDLTPPESDKAS
ncbi:MAG: hypothetical protein COB54_08895 [Alphaproteobacteria bacterium]|nr:MAG: hypothetical protein COB54_08895 [Alphaproteobacteria bacterium]